MNWHISCVNSYMKLYIISNRLPVKVTKEDETFVFSRSEGGLATGLDSLQISYEKHWIGWPGICVDNEESKEEIPSRLEGINFHPVFLSEIQIKNYYEGYSNSTIWPLCLYAVSELFLAIVSGSEPVVLRCHLPRDTSR